MQHFPTGHDDLELGTGSEQLCHLHASADHLLKVVEHEQGVLVMERGFQQIQTRLRSALFDLESLSYGGQNEGGLTDGSQVHEVHPIGEHIAQVCRYLQAQSGFAAAATSRPTYPSDEGSGSPVCSPMRTRTVTPSGQIWVKRACWAATAAETASVARAKATKKASPCVSTS